MLPGQCAARRLILVPILLRPRITFRNLTAQAVERDDVAQQL